MNRKQKVALWAMGSTMLAMSNATSVDAVTLVGDGIASLSTPSSPSEVLDGSYEMVSFIDNELGDVTYRAPVDPLKLGDKATVRAALSAIPEQKKRNSSVAMRPGVTASKHYRPFTAHKSVAAKVNSFKIGSPAKARVRLARVLNRGPVFSAKLLTPAAGNIVAISQPDFIAITKGELDLVTNPVPEPTSILATLMAGGMGVLFGRRRKKMLSNRSSLTVND